MSISHLFSFSVSILLLLFLNYHVDIYMTIINGPINSGHIKLLKKTGSTFPCDGDNFTSFNSSWDLPMAVCHLVEYVYENNITEDYLGFQLMPSYVKQDCEYNTENITLLPADIQEHYQLFTKEYTIFMFMFPILYIIVTILYYLSDEKIFAGLYICLVLTLFTLTLAVTDQAYKTENKINEYFKAPDILITENVKLFISLHLVVVMQCTLLLFYPFIGYILTVLKN